MSQPDATAADRFHAHLDECKRCRTRPFDLCPAGLPLLVATGRELPPQMTELRATYLDLGF